MQAHSISRICMMLAGLLLIAGCNTLGIERAAVEPEQVTVAVEPEVEPEPIPELEPPHMELDADLLEQLMITNFASYAGDWDSAMTSAMSAADLSQDFRLARMAAVLALRSRSYNEVAQASELWYQLDEDSEDAYNALLIGLVGSGNVAGALAQWDSRLQEIDLTVRQAAQQAAQQEAQQEAQRDQNQTIATPTGESQQNDPISETASLASPDKIVEKPIDVHIREISGLLVRQNNAESALQICEEYIRRHADSSQVFLSTAYVANYFERVEQAEQWLNKALEIRPNWDVAAQMYAGMLASQDRQSERLAYIRLYLKDNPKSVSMRIQYAAELARQEDYQAGLDIMQGVAIDDPENSEAIIYAAALAQQLEQDELAQDYYQKALVLEPDNYSVLWSLASYAIADEDYQQAEEYYEQVARGENYFRAQLQIANMRYETRGIDSAINVLRRVTPRTEGEFIELTLSRHYLLMQDHMYEEAMGYINDSLVYLPDSDDLVYARALVAAELKKVDIAESDFLAIINRNPEHANALNALGYTLADQTERYQEAKQYIQKALELEPTEGHILDSMGWVLYRLEDYEGAISFLKQAFEVLPEAEIAAHLGEVYWEYGQRQQAMEIWQKAYELDAKNAVLLETLERYEQLEQYAKQDVN